MERCQVPHSFPQELIPSKETWERKHYLLFCRSSCLSRTGISLIKYFLLSSENVLYISEGCFHFHQPQALWVKKVPLLGGISVSADTHPSFHGLLTQPPAICQPGRSFLPETYLSALSFLWNYHSNWVPNSNTQQKQGSGLHGCLSMPECVHTWQSTDLNRCWIDKVSPSKH